jgi:tRNA(fMet)-specific endonuclease VapC
MNRRKVVYDRARAESAKGNVIGVAFPVLAELYFGAENSKSRDRTIRLIQSASVTWRIWPISITTVRIYGQIAATLSKAGQLIQQFVMLIAATALDIGNCTVVSSDSDLLVVPNLTVENCTVP